MNDNYCTHQNKGTECLSKLITKELKTTVRLDCNAQRYAVGMLCNDQTYVNVIPVSSTQPLLHLQLFLQLQLTKPMVQIMPEGKKKTVCVALNFYVHLFLSLDNKSQSIINADSVDSGSRHKKLQRLGISSVCICYVLHVPLSTIVIQRILVPKPRLD